MIKTAWCPDPNIFRLHEMFLTSWGPRSLVDVRDFPLRRCSVGFYGSKTSHVETTIHEVSTKKHRVRSHGRCRVVGAARAPFDVAFIPVQPVSEYIWAFIRPTGWWISNAHSSMLQWELTPSLPPVPCPPSPLTIYHPSLLHLHLIITKEGLTSQRWKMTLT